MEQKTPKTIKIFFNVNFFHVKFKNIIVSYSLADLVVQGGKKIVLVVINSNPLTNLKSVHWLSRNDDFKVVDMIIIA